MENSNQEGTNQLVKLENNKILDIINSNTHLSDQDKKDLTLRVTSDDVELRKGALEKITQSQLAQHDLIAIQGEISALNKQGMYVKAKQTIKTGSGHVEIEMKGGDTNLIIPVLVIAGIVIIAALVIVFWKH